MTSWLVIFRVFFFFFFVSPTLNLKKKSRNSTNKKILALQTISHDINLWQFPSQGYLHFHFCERTHKVRKRAKIRNRYNQVPHLTKDTIGKVTTSQLDITNEGQ